MLTWARAQTRPPVPSPAMSSSHEPSSVALKCAECGAGEPVLVGHGIFHGCDPRAPVTMNAIGMTTGAAVLLAAALVSDEPIVLPCGFVIIPFVTIVLSAWLDNEPVGVGLVLGGLLVLAGVYVGALRPARAHSAAVNAKTDVGPSTDR